MLIFTCNFYRSRPSQPTAFPSGSATTTKVQLDSNVVLKIIKTAYDAHPSPISGQLLGLDDGKVLSVSHAFPFPASANDNEGSGIRSKSIQKYQTDVLSRLKEINTDINTVGYYISTNLGKFFNSNTIETLLSYQAANPNAILIVNDVSQTLSNGLSLHAYRLSESFIACKKDGTFTTESLTKNNLSYRNIFEKLPVEIHNSHLVTLFLQSLENKNLEQNPAASFDNNFSGLDISIDSFLEKNIESIFDSIDQFHADQGNYNYYQRQLSREKLKIQQWQHKRNVENSHLSAAGKPTLPVDNWQSLFKLPAEPSRLDNVLVSGQIDKYCTQIEEHGSTVSTKLFATRKSLNF